MSEHARYLDLCNAPSLNLGDVVVSIGVFDGLHLGHKALLERGKNVAAAVGVEHYAITFERDPDELFRQDDPNFGKLLDNDTRLAMLEELLDGRLLALPTSAQLFALEPFEFLNRLAAACSPRAVVVGKDFRFGARAKGTVADIREWGNSRSCRCEGCDLLEYEGTPVTASRIRALLQQGDVARAATLAGGRRHALTGRVVHGRGEGADMGFATANLDLSGTHVMRPKEGVYAGYARVAGVSYPAAINMGVAKSFDSATAEMEVHLLGFEGSLYDEILTVEFVEHLRDTRVFSDVDELVATVEHDIAWVRDNLGGQQHGTDF